MLGQEPETAGNEVYERCFSVFFELSFELLSLLDETSFDETSFDEPSLEDPSFEELSDLDFSSFLESLPEPSEEDCEEDFFG